MTEQGLQFRTIVRINAILLYAFVLGFIAWILWPETSESWRSGGLSIGFGLSSFGLAWRGIGETVHHIISMRKVARFERRGRQPHSDELAGDDAMRNSGMIE